VVRVFSNELVARGFECFFFLFFCLDGVDCFIARLCWWYVFSEFEVRDVIWIWSVYSLLIRIFGGGFLFKLFCRFVVSLLMEIFGRGLSLSYPLYHCFCCGLQ